MSKMEHFIMKAEFEMDEALEASQNTRVKFKALSMYFGEDESMTSNELFGTIQAFVIAFDAAHDQVLAQEKLAVRLNTLNAIDLYFLHLFKRLHIQ